MKKWLVIEICVLVLILAAAIGVCLDLPAFSASQPDIPQDTQAGSVQTGGSITQETTEASQLWMTFPSDRKLTAQQAFVYDCQAGEFTYLLGQKTDRVYPASITKLFTAYVALQFLEPETKITAGDVLDLVGVGSSVAGIEKGNVLSVEMLVEAMLLPSGNDAAYLLADAAGKAIKNDNSLSASAAVAAFLKEMNGQARSLGMSGTQFTNPDGYHSPDHYTTFADMVKMGEAVLKNETILKYTSVSKENAVFESGEVKQWENTNALINPESEYYCPIATGLKTGQTPSAGSCLLSSFAYEGRQWIIGVFGCPEIEDRFADTLQLLNEALGIPE